jgi:hypothetical protein
MPRLQPVPDDEEMVENVTEAEEAEATETPPADALGAFEDDDEAEDEEDGSVAATAADARPEQLAIEGLRPDIDDVAGGELPQTASAKLGGARVTLLDGQFKKGDEVWLLVRARCWSVSFPDTYASDGETVKSTERVHHLRTIAVRRAPKDVLGILEQRSK